MPDPSAAFRFLAARHSHPARALNAPAPEGEALREILAAALRVPDHGILEPWRLIVLERAALDRLAARAEARGRELDLAPEVAAKGPGQFTRSALCVAVVASPRTSAKVPEIEQILSAGALCMSLLNAAQAAGWGAAWITGWPAFDRPLVEEGLGLSPAEFIAGFVHIGTPGALPPERPRPALDRVVTWA